MEAPQAAKELFILIGRLWCYQTNANSAQM